MSVTALSREEQLFADALALPASQRMDFLARACAGEAALHARMRVLLQAHSGPESLLASAPAGAAPTVTSTSDEKPGDRIGRYKLLQKIGEGGCGVVWMAEQEEPVRRRVALKVIKLGMDTKAVVARFEAERQALAMMDHPNIAKVHDAGATDTGRPYFVMELVRGVPITRFCDDNNQSTRERLGLFIQVCHAIQHAHQKGIIHRDIKPSNVLVTLHDDVAVPMVIDFGIAKATQGRLTEATVFTAFEQFIGTPAYMSPEQAEYNALDVDTRSDVYSLGVLLYELLTGRPPFDPKTLSAAGLEQIRRIIRESEPPRPSARLRTLAEEERTTVARLRSAAPAQLATLLRGDLDWIAMKALEKNRTRRYQTANAFALDVQRFLAHEPIVARPPSPIYRVQKFAVRHKLGVTAAVVVAAALIAGLGLTYRAFLTERAAHARARQAEQIAEDGRARAEELLSFHFTEVAEELSDFGQTTLLEQMSVRTLAYYEGLPANVTTRNTRAAHALALAGVGSIGWMSQEVSGEFELGQPELRAKLTRALAMLDELEKSGPMSPFMRIALAGVVTVMSDQSIRERRFLDAVPLCERAERTLAGALDDRQWGPWAQRAMTKLLRWHGLCLVRGERPAEALPVLHRAISSAEAADRRTPQGKRPGLRATQIRVNVAEALRLQGKEDEARAVLLEVRTRLREYIAREPFLAVARFWSTLVTGLLITEAQQRWDKAELMELLREREHELSELLKSDTRYRGYEVRLLMNLADTNTSTFRLASQNGDWTTAEADLQRAIQVMQSNVAGRQLTWMDAGVYSNYAWLAAATGQDALADRMLREAHAAANAFLSRRNFSDVLSAVRWAESQGQIRRVERERLNWREVRRNAEAVLARLSSLQPPQEEQPRYNTYLALARSHLIESALALGDHAEARRQVKLLIPAQGELLRRNTISSRFNRLGGLALRVQALARSGDRAAAAVEMRRLWPEAEAVFAAGPNYLFNQVQFAHVLALRAEVEGTPAEKRAWLERAAGFLRPAAAAGKLTRFEREVRLAEVEQQLAVLAPTAAR